MNNLEIDVLTIGETLIDFISTEETTNGLRDATSFTKYLGGSPANIAVYVAKLGGKSAIISKTGQGPFGQFLKSELQHHGVNTNYLVMDHQVRTSIIFVSRGQETPQFEAFRDGDYKLSAQEISPEAIARAKVIHASTWGPSRQPSRAAVKRVFELAHEQGKIISFDPNYSPIIWPDYQEAQAVMRDLYQYATITKPSLDDAKRFFGVGYSIEQYLEMFHDLGPQTVIMTLGKAGAVISQAGQLVGHVLAKPIKVVDVTGAGDSFWAGFLVALLDGHPLETCTLFAREVVSLKLTSVGPLPALIDRNHLYRNLPDVAEAVKPNLDPTILV